MSETLTPSNLLAGSFPRVTRSRTLLTGLLYAEGTVLGKITASGKYTICDKAAVDGSQAPLEILLAATDATLADAVAVTGRTGQYNEDALVLGGTTTKDDVRAALEARSIFLETISA
ncbi:MAG: head decoration protein [Proteobacteria bacterium]|nr:head decoration protein [Pseudomonadota bacterium]MBU1640085.1 head decoration protein [Pseudomonadota bacterium]